MSRINYDEIENYSQNSSETEWLKLRDDGDVARVQFLYSSPDDLDIFACHRVKIGDKERYVDCKREYDSPIDDCPLCAAGHAIKPVLMLSMYDHSDGKVKVWERGKTFIKKMEAQFNRYPDLKNMVFEIERRGAKGDKKTQYELFPMPNVEPVDVSNIERPKFVGGFILDKTADEMQTYLDTKDFPRDDNNSDEAPVRRRNIEQDNEAKPVSRRGAGRRVGGR